MKPTLSKQQQEQQDCDPASCPNCCHCRMVKIEERPADSKTGVPQLYGKESEHYFFYYAFNMKQSS